MGRERDQAISAEDYQRADELKSQIDDRRARQEGQRETRARAPEVTMEDIAEIVSRRTGIPVTQLTQEERDRLLTLEERLHERVVGQDEAVEAIAEAVRRARAGLPIPGAPTEPLPTPPSWQEESRSSPKRSSAVRMGWFA